MKRLLLAVIAVAMLGFLCGMGNLGERAKPQEIPLPDRNFIATLTDSEGMVVNLRKVSVEGETCIVGRFGSGMMSVDFDKIRMVRFRHSEDAFLALLELKSGKSLKMEVSPDLRFYGETDFGNYMIRLRDITVLRIEGVASGIEKKER